MCKISQMPSKSRYEMDSGANETNYVYLFHIVVSILFILCIELLCS